MIRSLIKSGRGYWKIGFRMSSKKMSDIIEELSDTLNRQQLIKNDQEEEILKNYMDLTEESYLEQLLHQHKSNQRHTIIDPSIILMILPTLEKQQSIRQHLLMLFPHLPTFNSKELLLFFEYFLAHKMVIKPKIPQPKPIIDCQGLLVILAQVYPKDFLIQWLKQVPLYDGQNGYMLAMGAFSIISGLSSSVRQKNQHLIERCETRVKEIFSTEDSEVRIGIILLGLQMNMAIAQQLLLIPYCIDYYEVDGIKISLLLIELDKYIKQKYSAIRSVNPSKQSSKSREEEGVQIDEGIDSMETQQKIEKVQRYLYDPAYPEHIKCKLQELQLWLTRALMRQDWKLVIKLHTLVRLFNVLKGKKLQGGWLKFSERLFNFTIKKQQMTILTNLSTDQLIKIVEVLEELKVNRPQLLKTILVLLSDRLEAAHKQQLLRLAKCLVTYVRVCQDYLIHFRAILERRKFIFSFQDIQLLNDIFRRVQVLFPKPLTY